MVTASAMAPGSWFVVHERSLTELFDVVLPQHVLRHLSIHTRKQLRSVSKRCCHEVDRCMESLKVSRFNIDALTMIPVPARFPGLTCVSFQSGEPDALTSFLSTHLASLHALEVLDLRSYHASIKADVSQRSQLLSRLHLLPTPKLPTAMITNKGWRMLSQRPDTG